MGRSTVYIPITTRLALECCCLDYAVGTLAVQCPCRTIGFWILDGVYDYLSSSSIIDDYASFILLQFQVER